LRSPLGRIDARVRGREPGEQTRVGVAREQLERVLAVGGRDHALPVRAHRDTRGLGERVRGIVGVAHDRDAAQPARVGVAFVDPDRRRIEAGGIDVATVGCDRERGRAEVALALRFDEAQPTARVAREHDQRVVLAAPRRIPTSRPRSPLPRSRRRARAHRRRGRGHRREAQPAGLRVAREHGQRVVIEARDVDLRAVRRHCEIAGLIEPRDAAHAVAHHAGRSQRTRLGVAREDRDRVRAASAT
jgi:hypothetical protein